MSDFYSNGFYVDSMLSDNFLISWLEWLRVELLPDPSGPVARAQQPSVTLTEPLPHSGVT